jgi:hypothetical protein
MINDYIAFLVINVFILYFICYKQQKRIEFQKRRIDHLLLKLLDLNAEIKNNPK